MVMKDEGREYGSLLRFINSIRKEIEMENKIDYRRLTKKMKEVMLESLRNQDDPKFVEYDFCRRNLETLLKMKELGFLNSNSSMIKVIDSMND